MPRHPFRANARINSLSIWLLTVLFLSATFVCADAQKNKSLQKPAAKTVEKKAPARGSGKKNIKKGSKTTAKEQDEAALSVSDFLQSTAKLMIIDSVVVEKSEILKHIPLPQGCGRLLTQGEIMGNNANGCDTLAAYLNGFSDRCAFSRTDKEGKSRLYIANKIGGTWDKGRALEELGDSFESIDYPYLMPDGMTLYFSAIDKNNSFGKRDIFMTRLNTDSMKFYKAENIGLPYNSKANDYLCAIDDINNLGWLATDRNQPEGRVCIYTFIPTDERWTTDESILDDKTLRCLATLAEMKATQYDNAILKQAQLRLQKIKNGDSLIAQEAPEMHFIVNDNTVYHSLNDFKSATSRSMFISMQKLIKKQEADKEKLNKLRSDATTKSSKETKAAKATMQQLEKELEENETEIKIMEKKIRNAENLL